MAFLLLIFWIPEERTSVTTVARPSGITATANAIEIMRVSMTSVLYKKIWQTNINIHKTTPAIPRTSDILSRFF